MRREVEAILGLQGDDFRNVVLANAGALAHEVKDLPSEAQQRMVEVVEAAWPEMGVRANLKRDGDRITVTGSAHAWLTLGPALDVPLTSSQWADIATSGVVFTDTAQWLRRHYTEDGVLRAARSCESSGAREWAQLIGSIPDDVRIPDAVVEAVIARLMEPTVPEPDFELWQIGDRFAKEGRLQALQAIGAKNEELERRLRPWRARLGEGEAAKALLEEMVAALRENKRLDRDEADWLDGVDDATLLPLLFEALSAAVSSESESPFGVSGAISRAIHRIGGEDAVRMYDALIESSDDSRFKFLRLQRDELVQAELRVAGQVSAAAVAERLAVPQLEIRVSEPGS